MRYALNRFVGIGSLDLQGLYEHSSSERMETVPLLRMFRHLELILLEEDCREVSISDSVSSGCSSGTDTTAALRRFNENNITIITIITNKTQ
jgi:hypothetical protein